MVSNRPIVIVAVDGSRETERTVDVMERPASERSGAVATRLSRSSPVPVLVLPVPATLEEPAAPLSFKRIMAAVDFNVASAVGLRTAADATAFGVEEAEPVVTTGVPHRSIIEAAASTAADLIVMGVAPRTALDEAAFGSTLRAVLRRATIPVLVVPVVAGAQPWLEANGQYAFSADTIDGAATSLAA